MAPLAQVLRLARLRGARVLRRGPAPRPASSGSPARTRSRTSARWSSFFAGLPEVSDTQIGAWGISYGGGQAWNGLAAGIPTRQPNGRDLDRPLQRALAAEPREVGDRARLRARRSRRARRSSRAPRTTRSTRRTCRRSRRSPTPRSPYAEAPVDQDARLHVPGPRRLRVRRQQALNGYTRITRAEAPLHRPVRPPAVDASRAGCRLRALPQGVAWYDHYLKGAPNGIDKAPAGDDRRGDRLEAHVLRRPSEDEVSRPASAAPRRSAPARGSGRRSRRSASRCSRCRCEGATTRGSSRPCSPATA